MNQKDKKILEKVDAELEALGGAGKVLNDLQDLCGKLMTCKNNKPGCNTGKCTNCTTYLK